MARSGTIEAPSAPISRRCAAVRGSTTACEPRSRSSTWPNSGFSNRWYSDTSGGVRTTAIGRSRIQAQLVEHRRVGLKSAR